MRDDADWRGNLAYAGNMPAAPAADAGGSGGCDEYFILARERGRIAAYARMTGFHGFAMVMEYGYAADRIDAAVALLRHLGEMAATGNSGYRMLGDHRSARVLRGAGMNRGALLVTHSEHDPESSARSLTPDARSRATTTTISCGASSTPRNWDVDSQ